MAPALTFTSVLGCKEGRGGECDHSEIHPKSAGTVTLFTLFTHILYCMLFQETCRFFATLNAIVLLTYWKGNAQHGSLYGQPVRLGQGESVHIIICKNKTKISKFDIFVHIGSIVSQI